MSKVSPLVQDGILFLWKANNSCCNCLFWMHILKNKFPHFEKINSFLNVLAWGILTWSILKNLGPLTAKKLELIVKTIWS